MSVKKAAAPKTVTKKEINKEISDKLATALASYKIRLGEKKFSDILKKSSKIFAAGIIKANKKTNKTVAEKKKVTKKVTKKLVKPA